jgi:2-polyprenyl-6-methoxyphenol hydroxylase-like FAD-dependent oxidoreductase
MKNRDILISGASIAGLALAYWLRQYGFNPTVVEQAPAPREGGYAVDLRGAAREAAERMGIMADVRRAHVGTHGLSYVNGANKPVASMSSDLLGDSGGAIAEIEILRGDLIRILYAAAGDDVEYIFEDSISSISQGEEGVGVTFQRGEPRHFDLMVGADGLHSNVRALAFGDELEFVRDLGAHVSIFTTPNHLDLDGWELMYSTPGRTAAMYPARHNTEAKAMFFFASDPFPYDRHDIGGQKKILAEAFAGGGWEVPRLLEAMWGASDFYFDTVSQVHMDRWSNGRAVLVGDLKAAGGDHRRALVRYEEEMREYVEQGQKLPKGNATGLIPRSRLQIRIRNQIIRMLPYLPWRGLIAGGVQKAANAITLKDYEG